MSVKKARTEVEDMKCKFRDCENEVDQDNVLCPSCREEGGKPKLFTTEQKLAEVNAFLKQLSVGAEGDAAKIKEGLAKAIDQLNQVLKMVQCERQEKEELRKQVEFERTWQSQPRQEPIKPSEPGQDPYRIDCKSTR